MSAIDYGVRYGEKKVIEKERQEEERRLDTIMEIERLKALQMYAEREKKQSQARP